jgi:ABC-2 type transport system permease protein
VTLPTLALELRLRARSALLAAGGMIAVIVMVGALFPAVGGSIGKLDLPEGVTELLGGADYGTLRGWMRSEIGAVYGPLVIAGVAITAAAGAIAGDEEAGLLGIVLAHPIARARLVAEKGAAVAVAVAVVATGTFAGLVAGVALAGGGIPVSDALAVCVHLACFGFVLGALALAVAAATGRRAAAIGAAAAYGLLGFLINGFAPLIDGLEWLRYLSPFHYYAGSDPIAHGVDVSDLAVLLSISLALTGAAAIAIRNRDLRA